MITSILIGLAIIIALFVVIVALRPSDFRVTRSAAIHAPPEAIFARVNDLHLFQDWSPWAKLDPNARTTYAGSAAGVGAVFNWAGNSKIGAGRMTIVASRPSELVRFMLEFVRPFKGESTVEFTFKPDRDQTVVTWTMTGKNNFICKAMGLFINCDKMCGSQFEQGLAQMKSLVEAAAEKPAEKTAIAA